MGEGSRTNFKFNNNSFNLPPPHAIMKQPECNVQAQQALSSHVQGNYNSNAVQEISISDTSHDLPHTSMPNHRLNTVNDDLILSLHDAKSNPPSV